MSKLNEFKFFHENKPMNNDVFRHLLEQRRQFMERNRINDQRRQRRLRGGEEMYYDAHLIVNLQGLNHITQSININNNERV